MVLKKVKEDKIVMIGETQGKDACGNCIDLNADITSKIPKAEIPINYEHHSVYTDPKGQEIAQKHKVEEIPYTEHCVIAEDDTKSCKTVVGYKPEEWAEIGKKREVEFKEA